MRRITGLCMILAAFSGCDPQQRVAQGDQPPMFFPNRAIPNGPSWARPDAPQFTADPAPEAMSTRTGMGAVAQAGGAAPAASPPGTMVSKLPFPPNTPAGSAPLPADSSNTGISKVSYSTPAPMIDPALKDMPWVGSPAAIEKATAPAEPTPTRPPEVVAAPAPPLRSPEIPIEPKPIEPKPIEVKPTPVSVALDTKSTIGAPALRLVNTKRFTLSFSVQDADSEGVTVDLWETRDGKNWKKCENVQQSKGACHVEVKDEGVFGYTMAARAVSDKNSTQPKAGDVPQVWVTVDATKPVVTMVGVELNLTSKTPNLIVRWTAKDKNFGPRPITLSYAEHTEGPWLPLATNIENSGRYECQIPANMPRRALLRVEAVDLVGNTGSAQTDRLVRLDFSATPPAASNLLPPPPPHTAVPVEAPRPVVIIYNVEPSTSVSAKE